MKANAIVLLTATLLATLISPTALLFLLVYVTFLSTMVPLVSALYAPLILHSTSLPTSLPSLPVNATQASALV